MRYEFLAIVSSDFKKKKLLSYFRVLAITVCNTLPKTGTNIFFIFFALHPLLKTGSSIINIF